MATPSILARLVLRFTDRMRPVTLRSLVVLWLPEMTSTVSPERTWNFFCGDLTKIFFISEHLGGEGNDLHEVLIAEFASHRAEDASATGIEVLVDDHDGVVNEAQVAAVRAADRLAGSHDDRANHFPLLHGTARRSLLDVRRDHIADVGVERGF